MFYLFILFAISSQFNTLLRVSVDSQSMSAAPFAWGFALVAVCLYFFGAKKKNYMDIQTLSFLLIFFVVVLWFPFSMQSVFTEYIIRFLQFLSAFAVYVYSRNNFFLNYPKETIIKYFLILQLPSILFGLMEVVYILSDSELLLSLLYDIRQVTSGRPGVIYMKSIVFHFLEHSMSVSYILMLISIMIVWFSCKYQENNSTSILKELKYKSGLSGFSFFLISTFLFILFHRSGTFTVILAGSVFFAILNAGIRSKFYLLILSLPILYFLLNTPLIAVKVDQLMMGQMMANDFYRLSSVLSSLGNLLQYPFGIGPGSFSAEYFSGIIHFLDYFNLNSTFGDLVYSNADIISKNPANEVNTTRATSQTLYLGLVSELGVVFILFLFVFHKNIFLKRFSMIKFAEVAIILNLCLGYPMAYPQLWIALGLIHAAYNQNKT